MLFMVFLIFLWGSSGAMGVAVLTADEESNLDGYIKSFINCKGVPGKNRTIWQYDGWILKTHRVQ